VVGARIRREVIRSPFISWSKRRKMLVGGLPHSPASKTNWRRSKRARFTS
jgi:hypothetical protein